MTQESFIYSFVARDEGIPVTAEKIATLVKAANVPVESYWPGLFAKLYGKRNIEDLVLNAGFGDAVSIAAQVLPKLQPQLLLLLNTSFSSSLLDSIYRSIDNTTTSSSTKKP
ncbi:hypothetical protein COP2_017901 [Malus domestica]